MNSFNKNKRSERFSKVLFLLPMFLLMVFVSTNAQQAVDTKPQSAKADKVQTVKEKFPADVLDATPQADKAKVTKVVTKTNAKVKFPADDLDATPQADKAKATKVVTKTNAKVKYPADDLDASPQPAKVENAKATKENN